MVLSIILIAYQLKNNKLTITNILSSFNDKISFVVNFGITIGLILYVYLPFFNKVANTSPLTLKRWLFIVVISLLAVLPFDVFKIKVGNGVKYDKKD